MVGIDPPDIAIFAARPQTPKNCTLQNSTGSGHLEVVCRGAHGGGLEQEFVLEVGASFGAGSRFGFPVLVQAEKKEIE